MSHAKTIGRFGILAVGIGIGAALAATSPTAAADPGAPGNPLPLVPDLALGALADPASTPDIAISIDGIPLVQSGSAVADSGFGDIAIAMGAGSTADAGSSEGSGLFDTAFADGIGATATSGGGNFDGASANGTDSNAFAADGNFDSAFASGTDSDANVGGFSDAPSSFDYASAVGNETTAESGVFGAFSGATGGDFATVWDPSGTSGSGAFAGNGLADLATVFGDGNTAHAGEPGSFDFAGIFGDHLGVLNATGADFLFGTLPPL